MTDADEPKPPSLDDPALQLVHLKSKRKRTGIQGYRLRWIREYTCCGLDVNDFYVYKVTMLKYEVTCEECKRGYALDVLAELP